MNTPNTLSLQAMAQAASDFYVQSIRDGRTRVSVETFVGARYTQHNPTVGDGPEAFRTYFHDMSHEYSYRDVVTWRSFAQDDLAFLHVLQDLGDGGVWITMDLFAFDGDRIVEHWDNLVQVDDYPTGLAAIGGSGALSGLEDTAATEALGRQVIESFINTEPMAAASAFDHRKFRHHDNGASERGFVAEWTSNRDGRTYAKMHKVVAQNNFVVIQSEGTEGETPMAFLDLFRTENGLIVEHWEVNEAIVDPADAKHSNGKF